MVEIMLSLEVKRRIRMGFGSMLSLDVVDGKSRRMGLSKSMLMLS
ncbi:hypothetical protein Goarm_014343 [Gossypium armourianum]|uniref:Uncharacterized protein n=1 Tax=Gossypium armourianum TaxID=34283 RepID=A0A7J9J5S3_9ROSI|nr:hypothetical protein [Gossypium armourianum]